MANQFEVLVRLDNNYQNCTKNTLKDFEAQCKQRSGVGVIVLGHPSGASYYGSELAAAKRKGFEVVEFEEWISDIGNSKCHLLKNREMMWMAEQLGEMHQKGTMTSLMDIKSGNLKSPVYQSYKTIVEMNGYKSQSEAEAKLAKRAHEPDYRTCGICVLDADYLTSNGLKIVNNYAELNEIALTVHFNEDRCLLNNSVQTVNEYLQRQKMKGMVNCSMAETNLKRMQVTSEELVRQAVELCEKNHGGVLVSDNSRETILIEFILSCGDVRYNRFGGSVVETSKGIRAYYIFLMFLMSRGVDLLKDLCESLGINYNSLYQAAKEKNDSIRFEEYQKVISYCYFSEHTKEATVVHELIDCKHKGVIETTKTFLNCISEKLSDKEKSELDYCLELISHMDTETRVNAFERMRFYQIEEASIVKLSSMKEALSNKSKLKDQAVIIINSEPKYQCVHHAEELCSFSKCGYLIEYMQPKQNREVA